MSSFTAPARFYYDTGYYPNIAFIGDRFPLLVLDPGCKLTPEQCKKRGVETVLAYTSAVEMAKDSRFYHAAINVWEIKTLGKNPHWDTYFMDAASEKWREFYRDEIAQDAVDKGYDGVVLDTFDMGVDIDNAGLGDLDAILQSLCAMVASVKEKFGNDFLVVPNRGFEHWDLNAYDFRGCIDGMLVESYRTGSDFKWLSKRVRKVKAAGKPVLVIEYTPNKAKAKEITKLNKEEGMPTLVCASQTLSPPKVVWYNGKGKEV